MAEAKCLFCARTVFPEDVGALGVCKGLGSVAALFAHTRQNVISEASLLYPSRIRQTLSQSFCLTCLAN